MDVPGARLALAIAALYFVADNLLTKVVLGDGWQIFWPLNGASIALLIMREPRQWLLVLAAVSVGTGLAEYLDHESPAAIAVQCIMTSFEVLLSAWLLPRFVTLETWLRQPGLYARFAGAVIAGPVISGVVFACYANTVEDQPFRSAFVFWAPPDIIGIAAVLPLVLALRSAQASNLRNLQRWAVAAATLGAAVAVIFVIFATSRYPLIFVLYPLLMLIDWLLGLLGSSAALCCACLIAVYLTEHGYGAFADTTATGVPRNLAVQLYLGFHLIGFLPVSILFIEKRRIDRELRESLTRVAALASLDGLTNVANRRALDSHLHEQWQLAVRNRTCLALLMIDADHFKAFNDRLGHHAGDECLRAVAASLRGQVCRPADLVARYGGEEFAVVLPDTPVEGAKRVAESVRAAIYDLAIAHPGSPEDVGRVTVSIGCAAFVPAPDSDLRELIEDADQALYLAKHGGRNRVCVADGAADTWGPGAAARRLRARIESYRLRRARDRVE